MQQASLSVDTIVTLNSAGHPVTTSMAIADGVGNPHASVIRLVRDNLSDLNEFGRVGFEIAPFETRGGTQSREVAVLNEPQSTLLMTYMRNNDVVRAFKKRLVRAFFELARERHQAPEPTARAFGSTGDPELDRRLDCEQAVLERAGIPKGEAMAGMLRAAIAMDVSASAPSQAPKDAPSVPDSPAQQLYSLLVRHFDYSQPAAQQMTATAALQACGIEAPTRSQATTLGALLTKINGRGPNRAARGNVHWLPPMKH